MEDESYLSWPIEDCKNILLENPNDSRALYRLGIFNFTQNAFVDAKEMFGKCIELNPNFRKYEIIELYGDSCAKIEKELPNAIQAYTKLIAEQNKPHNIGELYMKLGKSYEKCKDLPKAIEAFTQCCSLLPTSLVAEFRLGWAYIRHNDKTNGVIHLKKTLELDKNNVDVLTKLGEVLFKDRETIEEAMTYLKKALEINAKFLDAMLLLGRAYDQKEELDSAIEILERAKAEYPKNSSIYYYLGRVYFKKTNYTKSISSFEECISIFQFKK